jgi:hypothetical protein
LETFGKQFCLLLNYRDNSRVSFAKVLERHWSSWKFASLFATSTLVSLVVNLLVLSLFRDKLKYIAPGPFGFICTFAWFYNNDIPLVYNTKIMNIPLSNRAMNNFLLFQVGFD